MKHDEPSISLLATDDLSAERYAVAFRRARLRLFSARYVPARRQISEPGYDALYWTLSAAERWNVKPIEDIIQCIETSEEDRKGGWPKYLLVGLVLSPPNHVDAMTELRAWARALLNVLREPPSGAIARVKVPMDMMSLEGLTPEHVAAILAGVENEPS